MLFNHASKMSLPGLDYFGGISVSREVSIVTVSGSQNQE